MGYYWCGDSVKLQVNREVVIGSYYNIGSSSAYPGIAAGIVRVTEICEYNSNLDVAEVSNDWISDILEDCPSDVARLREEPWIGFSYVIDSNKVSYMPLREFVAHTYLY